MNLKAWWIGAWFRESNYIDLAVVRILAVATTLIVTMVYNYSGLQLVLALPDSLYYPLPALKIFTLPWGWGTRHTAETVNIIYWLTLIFGFSSLIGFRTNISLFLFAIGSIFIQAVIYGFGEMHHREAIMMIALLALSLSPSGRVISLDNYLGKGYNAVVDSVPPTYSNTSIFAHWPLLLIQVFFTLMYLSAVVSKVYVAPKMFGTDTEWLNGFTLQYYMIQDGFRYDSGFALWLSQFHSFLYFAQIIVLWFQATFGIIFIFPKAKWLYVPLGLFFHLFILISLHADFYHWIILYSVFVPWSRVFEYCNINTSKPTMVST